MDMTSLEFNNAAREELAHLPLEFHGFLRSQAWDISHSSGYEAVLNTLGHLCYEFNSAWEDFQEVYAITRKE